MESDTQPADIAATNREDLSQIRSLQIWTAEQLGSGHANRVTFIHVAGDFKALLS